MRPNIHRITTKIHQQHLVYVWVAAFTVIGVATLLLTKAATPSVAIEAESSSGTRSSFVTVGNASDASGGQFIQFASPACPAGQTGTPPNCVTPQTGTLPPGSSLPSDATCSARVSHKPETRSVNVPFNTKAGTNKGLAGTYLSRVSGAYTGSTDEILQWVACKWGIETDVIRAEAAKESWWDMRAKGDFANSASVCPPAHGLGVDGRPGECPESYGLLQIRYQYHGPLAGLNTWPEAETSTAYNADYMYAFWRTCYEGEYTWLGGNYAAGDLWGCVGVWFSGRWHTPDAETYIQAVKDYQNQKVWETPGFLNF